MEVTIYDKYQLSIHSGTRKQVKELWGKLLRNGAIYDCAPQQDPDTELWFATCELPDQPKTFEYTLRDRQLIFTCLKAVARSLHCVIYVDIYRPAPESDARKVSVRIKGANAHDPGLSALVSAMVGMKRIRSYQSGIGPALSINLTGTHIVRSREKTHDSVSEVQQTS